MTDCRFRRAYANLIVTAGTLIDLIESERDFMIFRCGCIVLLISASIPCAPAERNAKIRSLVVPLYSSLNAPIAVFRVAEVSTGHQRRGFFRIGLLPQLSLTDVKITVMDTAFTIADLQTIHKLPLVGPTKSIAIRGLSLELSGSERKLLKAARVEIDEAGHWRLFDVSLDTATEKMKAQSATLLIYGKEAGRLLLQSRSGPMDQSFLPSP